MSMSENSTKHRQRAMRTTQMAKKIEEQVEQTPVTEAPAKTVFAKDVPKERLEQLMRSHVWSAMAVGLIPLPLVDFAAVTVVQLNLLRKLTQEYGIKFSASAVKNTLGALVGGVIPATAGPGLAFSLSKFVPVLGTTLGVITLPILSGATTYAIGKVFIQHFASGGTLLTFNADKMKAYYAEMLKEGQHVATAMKNEPVVPEEVK